MTRLVDAIWDRNRELVVERGPEVGDPFLANEDVEATLLPPSPNSRDVLQTGAPETIHTDVEAVAPNTFVVENRDPETTADQHHHHDHVIETRIVSELRAVDESQSGEFPQQRETPIIQAEIQSPVVSTDTHTLVHTIHERSERHERIQELEVREPTVQQLVTHHGDSIEVRPVETEFQERPVENYQPSVRIGLVKIIMKSAPRDPIRHVSERQSAKRTPVTSAYQIGDFDDRFGKRKEL